VPLADHIDQWYAEEGAHTIVLDRLEPEAMYAILLDSRAASHRLEGLNG
jgi:hypothetical protein